MHAHRVHGDDPGVVDGGERAALAQQVVGGNAGAHDLDGHAPVEDAVVGLVDLAHPARAEHAADLVGVGDDLALGEVRAPAPDSGWVDCLVTACSPAAAAARRPVPQTSERGRRRAGLTASSGAAFASISASSMAAAAALSAASP